MTDRVEAETVTHLCYKVIGHVSEGKALWDADFGSIIDTLRALLAERDALYEEVMTLSNGGIVEVAARNQCVMDSMREWEERANRAEAENQRLRAAGQAVVARWDTPLWKEAEETLGYAVNRLRAALAEQEKTDDQ